MVTKAVDRRRIERALKAVQKRTAIEIQVSVARPFWGDVRATADRVFRRLETERRTALILVVPWRRRVVVLGDGPLHERFGQAAWDEIASSMARRFRMHDMTDALEHGIWQLSTRAAIDFPALPE